MLTSLEQILSQKILPAVTIERVVDAVPAARAILRGGLKVMEVPFRTPEAARCIEAIRRQVPEMQVGAGTILRESQLDACMAAGASFALAPGLNSRIVRRARVLGLPFIPGVMTPSEVERAIELNCRVLKVFPISQLGGPDYLRAIDGPYGHLDIRYIPMGGVNSENIKNYLQPPNVLAVGGSWLTPGSLIRAGDWEEIARQVRQSLALLTDI